MLFTALLVLSLAFWGVLIAVTLGLALIYVLLALVVYLFVQSAFIAHLRGDAIRVSATQYADLQQSFEECCDGLGLMRRPELYLHYGHGVSQTLALRFLGCRFVVLPAELVGALEAHKNAIRFYIGHELAHLQRRHLSWRPLLFPASLLPLLGAAYARACERTADRYGVECCRNPNDAAFALVVLAAGPRRWSTTAIDEYAAQASERPGFWMSFHGLIGNRASLASRMLRIRAQASGQEPDLPRRNPGAWLLALFVPHLGLGGRLGQAMLVLALLGVLTAIALPAYQDYRIRTRVEAGLAQAGQAKLRVARYIARNHKAPSSNVDIGLPRRIGGDAVTSLSIGLGGAITIEFAELSPELSKRTIVLRPRVVGQRLLWSCRGGDLEARYRPPLCR